MFSLKKLFSKKETEKAPDSTNTIEVDQALQDFLVVLEKEPDDVDFNRLRMAYAESSIYDPYLVKDGIDQALLEVQKASEGTDSKKIIQAVRKVLEMNYLILNTHFTATITYGNMSDPEKKTHHQKIINNWLKSIQQSGNGLSFKTAFKVVSLEEEYALLNIQGALMGFEWTQQRFESYKDRFFDVFTIRELKTGNTSDLFFNIDPILKGIKEGRAKSPGKQ